MSNLSDRVRPGSEAAPWVIDQIRKLETRCEQLLQEAQIHHGEDAAHKSVQLEIYQALGIQRGDWNGAKPVLEKFAALQSEVQRLQAAQRWIPVGEREPPVNEWIDVAIKRTRDVWHSSAVITDENSLEDWDGSDLGYVPEDIDFWRARPHDALPTAPQEEQPE